MRFLAIFTALMLVIGAARADLLTPSAFTEAAAAAARAAMPSATVSVAGDLHLETRSAGGEEVTTDLRNAYDVYRSAPAHLDQIIHDYVGVLVESVHFGENKLDRSHIVPVFKPQQWLAGVRRGVSPQAPQILSDPYNDELAIVYAEDLPTSIRFLTTRDYAEDHAKLLLLALTNLHRLLTKIEMRPGPDGTWLVSAGGNYESSLLLADQMWSSGQIKVDGAIVVGVPVRSALFVTGSHNRAGVARLRAISAELAAGPYGLTPDLLVYRDGKFVKFDGN
jgi:uncharacterized protein YtpQ (UPF0354 family)